MSKIGILSICLSVIIGSLQPVWASDYPPRKPSPVTVRQIHSGHSLTDAYMGYPIWPGMLTMATANIRGTDPWESIGKSTIPGASLEWRWNNAVADPDPDAREDISNYELLVTTAGSPLTPDPEWFQKGPLDHIEKWVNNTWENGNRGKGAELMLYSTWVPWKFTDGTDPGPEGHIPFREWMDIQEGRWEQLQDHANAVRPEGMPVIYMIPGHRLIMRVYDDIEAGEAPGLENIGDIYLDDIHMNTLGAYAVTCLVWAVVYQRNPREIPNSFTSGEKSVTIPYEQAKYFQKVAWEVAQGYERAGVP